LGEKSLVGRKKIIEPFVDNLAQKSRLWHGFLFFMKNTLMKKLAFLSLGLITAALFSCSKDSESPLSTIPGGDGTVNTGAKTMLHIRLTDAPVNYDSVVVNIQEVLVKFSDDDSSSIDSTSADSGWVSLTTNAGFYDLLSFQNGLDTLIAASSVPTDTLQQIRMILGSGNYIVVGGAPFPLSIPSGSQSGLKINLNKILNPVLDSVIIDFDAAASVKQQGNGKYFLRPVLLVK
jgi:hypothetical protein